MRSLRFAFFGSSLVSAYWNGAATYFRGVLKELHRQGHAVTFYEPDAFERQRHRDLEKPDFARSVVYPATARGLDAALEEGLASDVVVKASGVGFGDAVLEEAVAHRPGAALRIFWDVDAPATLAALENGENNTLRRAVPAFDAILTYGGGDPVVERYGALGARQCVPVYNACDPDHHHPAAAEERFVCSLAFAGNRLPDREARVHEFFFRAAREAPGERFLLAGSGWAEDLPPLPNLRLHGHLYTRDHNAFNCSARAVLNVCRESMAKVGFSPPTRVFEVAGAGACLITDDWRGIEHFLTPGEECLVARDGAEVARLLRGLRPEEAAAIGERGRHRILREHTYRHRAEGLERILAGLLASSAAPSASTSASA
jgi:spore maturation protein CgeB